MRVRVISEDDKCKEATVGREGTIVGDPYDWDNERVVLVKFDDGPPQFVLISSLEEIR